MHEVFTFAISRMLMRFPGRLLAAATG